MLINSCNPQMACLKVYVVNNPCWLATLARAVRKTNQNYYSNENVTPRHIQKLVTLVVRAGERCSRRRNKTLSFTMPSRLSQLHKES